MNSRVEDLPGVRIRFRTQALEHEKVKHLADLKEFVELEQKRMKQLSVTWKKKFRDREQEVIKENAALLQLHGDLVIMSAAFITLRMKLPLSRDLDREALILADDTLGNRTITFDALVEQKWLESTGESPVSALRYENYQF